MVSVLPTMFVNNPPRPVRIGGITDPMHSQAVNCGARFALGWKFVLKSLTSNTENPSYGTVSYHRLKNHTGTPSSNTGKDKSL